MELTKIRDRCDMRVGAQLTPLSVSPLSARGSSARPFGWSSASPDRFSKGKANGQRGQLFSPVSSRSPRKGDQGLA
eukprot:3980880-Prymnesium_polylepis.1